MVGNEKDLYNVKVTLTNLEAVDELDITPLINSVRVYSDYKKLNKPIFIIDFLANRYLANEINISGDVKIQLEVKSEERLNSLSISQYDQGDEVQPILYDVMLKPINHTKYTIPDAKDYDYKSREQLREEDFIHVLAKDTIKFRMEAFDIRHVPISEHFVNVSVKDVTVEDVIKILVSQSGLNIDYFNFVTPDNMKQYPQIFIPPMKLSAAIRHIDEKYGIYKDRYKFFLDDDSLYLIPFSRTISLEYDHPRTNPMEVKYAAREDRGDSRFTPAPHVLVLPDSPLIKNVAAEAIRAHGDRITFLTYGTDGGTMSDTTVATLPLLEKYLLKKMKSSDTRITSKGTSREFFMECYLANIFSGLITTTITYYNNNKQPIKPETIFSLDSNTSPVNGNDIYSGAWSVNSQLVSFIKSDSYFTCSVDASINKIIDVSGLTYV